MQGTVSIEVATKGIHMEGREDDVAKSLWDQNELSI